MRQMKIKPDNVEFPSENDLVLYATRNWVSKALLNYEKYLAIRVEKSLTVVIHDNIKLVLLPK